MNATASFRMNATAGFRKGRVRTPKTSSSDVNSSSSDVNYNKNENTSTNKSFCGKAIRIASTTLFVIPYIAMNIGSGVLKGLLVSTIRVSNRSYDLAYTIGHPGTQCSVFWGYAGMFVGAIVSTIIVAPSLVVGAVAGLCTAVFRFPKTMQLCVEKGVYEAARNTVSPYHLGRIKLLIDTDLYSSPYY